MPILVRFKTINKDNSYFLKTLGYLLTWVPYHLNALINPKTNHLYFHLYFQYKTNHLYSLHLYLKYLYQNPKQTTYIIWISIFNTLIKKLKRNHLYSLNLYLENLNKTQKQTTYILCISMLNTFIKLQQTTYIICISIFNTLINPQNKPPIFFESLSLITE